MIRLLLKNLTLVFMISLLVSGINAKVPDAYEFYTTSLTIPDGDTSGSVIIPTSIRGKVIHAYATAEDLTSVSAYTIRLGANSGSAGEFFWESASTSDNGTAEFIGKTNTTVDFAPLPKNTAVYWIAKSASATSGTKTISITYAVDSSAPSQFTYLSKDITIANGASFDYVAIDGSLGKIFTLVANIPSLTSNVNTVFSVAGGTNTTSGAIIGTTDNAQYIYASGNVPHNAITAVIMPSVAGLDTSIPIENQSTPHTYIRAKAAGTQTGAKTITLYYVVGRDISIY